MALASSKDLPHTAISLTHSIRNDRLLSNPGPSTHSWTATLTFIRVANEMEMFVFLDCLETGGTSGPVPA